MAGDTKITLDSGIEIRLDCLFQYWTYGGLLEGLPTRKVNAAITDRAVGVCRREALDRRGTSPAGPS